MTPVIERLERFRELAREFQAATESGDEGMMSGLLSERRRLVLSLEDEQPILTGPEEEQKARAKVIEAILEIDRETEEVLLRQRDDVGEALLAIESGRRGLDGYGAGGRKHGKLIDERG